MIRVPALSLICLAAPLSAGTEPMDETLRFFNDCAGRVAAHISVHGWNDRETVTHADLARIDAIVAAFPGHDRDAELARHRSAARAAQVALLQHAMEYGDLDALGRARAHVDRCREAILSP